MNNILCVTLKQSFQHLKEMLFKEITEPLFKLKKLYKSPTNISSMLSLEIKDINKCLIGLLYNLNEYIEYISIILDCPCVCVCVCVCEGQYE